MNAVNALWLPKINRLSPLGSHEATKHSADTPLPFKYHYKHSVDTPLPFKYHSLTRLSACATSVNVCTHQVCDDLQALHNKACCHWSATATAAQPSGDNVLPITGPPDTVASAPTLHTSSRHWVHVQLHGCINRLQSDSIRCYRMPGSFPRA